MTPTPTPGAPQLGPPGHTQREPPSPGCSQPSTPEPALGRSERLRSLLGVSSLLSQDLRAATSHFVGLRPHRPPSTRPRRWALGPAHGPEAVL